jgi:hypothetical protein
MEGGRESVVIGLYYESAPSLVLARIELQMDAIADQWEAAIANAGNNA